MDKFPHSKDGSKSAKLYDSLSDAIVAAREEAFSVAKVNGFNTIEIQPGSSVCRRIETGEIIEIFPGGMWEYRDVINTEIVPQAGTGAEALGWFLADGRRGSAQAASFRACSMR